MKAIDSEICACEYCGCETKIECQLNCGSNNQCECCK